MKQWFLPSLIVIFGCISVLTLRSVAPAVASQQLAFFGVGLVVFWLTSRFSFQKLLFFSHFGYAVVTFLLLLLLIMGVTTRGIAAWITVGSFFSIQPSQLGIPLGGLFLVRYLATHPLQKLQHVLMALAIILLPGILIVLEPDLGTFIVYLLSLGAAVFIAHLPWKYVWTLGLMGVIVGAGSWLFLLQPYQKSRITSFATGHDAQGASYNARQALIAVGSGQAIGRGLGQGVQSHLRFLPERQTDFIFASLAEEWGFLGALTIISLYIGLVGFCWWIASQTNSPAVWLYCIITASMITVQVAINIGMNISLMPITGITLPLLSYGGSSVVSVCVMLGVVQSALLQLKERPSLHLT